MKPETSVKLKIAVIIVLALVAVVVASSYFGTFDTQKDMERRAAEIEKRWARLRALPLPDGATSVVEEPNGSMEIYGINMSQRMILDVSDLKEVVGRSTVDGAVQKHYVKQLLEWHPGLTREGVIAGARTVEGQAGLALVETEEFWYEDVLEGRMVKEIAEIVLKKYPAAEGRGRRFVIVRIVLCTRPK